MRRLLLTIPMLMLLVAAVSCVVDVTPKQQLSPLELALGLDEPEMPVRIGFDLPFEEPLDPETKASIVGGTEDPAEYVKTLYMVCFTHDGIYLGWREAVLEGSERQIDHDGVTGCWGRDLFTGSVPGRTARIHFVANVTTASIPDNGQIGYNENTLVHSARMSVNATDNQTICYWGFHGEASSEAMRDWLAEYDPDTQTYHKVGHHSVHLVRDRARVQFRYMFDYKRDAATTLTLSDGTFELQRHQAGYDILSIDWILTNGLDHGYLAPYCLTQADHFDDYIEYVGGQAAFKKDRLTEYDRSDGHRYTATEADMVNIYTKPGSGSSDPVYGGSGVNPLFLFEDLNNASRPPKLILRVRYDTDGDGTADKTKYHVLMILNEQKQPRTIYRNHNYILDIYGLPYEGIGYSSFEAALNGTSYSNNLTVTISDAVQAVNDGRFALSLEDTYVIYQNPGDVNDFKSVGFTYEAIQQGESTSGLNQSNFTVGWDLATGTQVDESFAHPEVSIINYSNNGTKITGRIQFQLGSSISSELQSGTIKISDANSGLTRFIHVYTINKFDFLPEGVSVLKLEATGGSRNIQSGTNNGNPVYVSCPTYKMQICIPGDYPLGLYPIRIRMASTTLNPYQVVRTETDGTNSQTATDVSVLMEGTENGTVLEGETLAGMDFETSQANAWNYRATGSPWNFWYTYRIISKPEIVTNGASEEDTNDKLYTIYFDDVRGLRATGNQASNVGLFLKIRYFGDAVAVTYTP